jgi:hypothetical protein
LILFPKLFFELWISFLFGSSSESPCNDVIIVTRIDAAIGGAATRADSATILSIAWLVCRPACRHASFRTKIALA